MCTVRLYSMESGNWVNPIPIELIEFITLHRKTVFMLVEDVI